MSKITELGRQEYEKDVVTRAEMINTKRPWYEKVLGLGEKSKSEIIQEDATSENEKRKSDRQSYQDAWREMMEEAKSDYYGIFSEMRFIGLASGRVSEHTTRGPGHGGGETYYLYAGKVELNLESGSQVTCEFSDYHSELYLDGVKLTLEKFVELGMVSRIRQILEAVKAQANPFREEARLKLEKEMEARNEEDVKLKMKVTEDEVKLKESLKRI